MVSEAVLIQRARLGRVIPLIQRAIYDVALQQSGSHHDAEDVAQEAILKILESNEGVGFIGYDCDDLETMSELFRKIGEIGDLQDSDDLEDLSDALSRTQGREPYMGPFYDSREPYIDRANNTRPLNRLEYLDLSLAKRLSSLKSPSLQTNRTPLDELIDQESLTALEREIDRLPNDLRAALESSYSDSGGEYGEDDRGVWGDLSFPNRAAALSISVGVYTRRVGRAKERLKAVLYNKGLLAA